MELRERATRMVLEHGHEHPSQWKAIESVAEKLGVHRETLRVWVRRVEMDEGHRPGLTTDERARMKELWRTISTSESTHLARQGLGRIATASSSGEPDVAPVTFQLTADGRSRSTAWTTRSDP